LLRSEARLIRQAWDKPPSGGFLRFGDDLRGKRQAVPPERPAEPPARRWRIPIALFGMFGYKPPVRTVRQGMPWPFFTLEMRLVSRLETKKNGVAKCPR